MNTVARDLAVTWKISKATLTNAAINKLAVGQELKDDRIPGLSVRRNAGGFSYLIYYRTKAGIQRRPKIGEYPVIKIDEARAIARDMLVRVANGEDPSAMAAADEDPTMNDLWDRVEREHYNRDDKDWHKEAKRLWTNHLKPKLGKLLVRYVGYDDVKPIHAAMHATPIEANMSLAVLSKMLSLAEKYGPERKKWRPINSNPCSGIERYTPKKRRRYAKAAELAVIGPILERFAKEPRHVAGVAFLYLLMFSGARPSEILRANPNQLERVEREGKVFGILHLDEAKTGERDVFLPPQAMAVLDKLPASRARLAGRKTMPRELWYKIRKEAGCEDLWQRDMRRTFASNALSSGVSLGQVGELLGHASTQTTKIYAKLLDDDAHIAAVAAATRIETALGGAGEMTHVLTRPIAGPGATVPVLGARGSRRPPAPRGV